MRTVEVKLTGIEWDTDGEQVELPFDTTVWVEADETDTDDQIMDAAVDKASDETGWCISGVATKEIVENWP
jgi:hypothetical protein